MKMSVSSKSKRIQRVRESTSQIEAFTSNVAVKQNLTMSDLLNFVKVRNESFVSVQVCDEAGGFVFYDRNSENST